MTLNNNSILTKGTLCACGERKEIHETKRHKMTGVPLHYRNCVKCGVDKPKVNRRQ